MTVAKMRTRLGGYLACKYCQGKVNLINSGIVVWASHAGGRHSQSCHLCSQGDTSVQEIRIQECIRVCTPCPPCSRLTVLKSCSAEKRTCKSKPIAAISGLGPCDAPTPPLRAQTNALAFQKCLQKMGRTVNVAGHEACPPSHLLFLPNSCLQRSLLRYQGCVQHTNC